MPKHDQIRNDELRGMLDDAYANMRAGKGGLAVRRLADAYLCLLELKPELLTQRVAIRQGARQMPAVMRWPALGANFKLESLRSGKPEIEFVRERFAVSEAMTYYEYTTETALRAGA